MGHKASQPTVGTAYNQWDFALQHDHA